MKKLLCVTIALLCTATMQAQEEEKDVTKFLGIPVDGYKPAMIEKLKAKGFTSTTWDKDVLEGEFNGADVQCITLRQTTIKFGESCWLIKSLEVKQV